jgi:hypothetical protein
MLPYLAAFLAVEVDFAFTPHRQQEIALAEGYAVQLQSDIGYDHLGVSAEYGFPLLGFDHFILRWSLFVLHY